MNPYPRRPVREALALLGIRRLLLGIHDAAFPSLPGEDVGRGSPHSDAAADFLELAAELGFDGLQLGPQGATAADNASPYDGALFSRDPLSIALLPLTREEWGALLPGEALEAAVSRRPGPATRVEHAYAFSAVRRALDVALGRLRDARAAGRGPGAAIASALDAFRVERADWLERDALYDVLHTVHGGVSWRHWRGPSADLDRRLLAPGPGEEGAAAARRRSLLAVHAGEVEAYAFAQFLVHTQHALLRARARRLGLVLYGDLQVGMAERDAWAAQAFLLRGWRMGAPPSRTNPEGQAWNYRLLDPARWFEVDGTGARRDGPGIRFLRARAEKAFAEFDGLRVDHPHGLVCPWVYRAGGDPDRAVRAGARLFSSPALPEHPELASYAIARPDQLDRSLPRHADGWVRWLDPEQVERYAALFDVVVGAAPDRREIACEILSTQPYPLARVIARHALGRFRVTQKADLDREDDVYRGENAGPEDWILLGNHDTPPIWIVAEGWHAQGTSRRQAEYLASRLLSPEEDREGWIRAVAADPRALVQARLADLFVGPARHVMIFFTDLFGARAPYNVPGTVSDLNWSLRVPHDFRRVLADRRAAGCALDLPRALARALRSRGASFAAAHRDLVRTLERGEGS